MFRLMLGLPLAAAVTAALFVLMSSMIRQDAEILDAAPIPEIKYLAEKPREKIFPEDRPDSIEKDPPPIDIAKTPPGEKPGPVVAPRPGPGPTDPGDGGGFVYLRPVLDIPPTYPEQCRAAGAEGSVIVTFDVTDAGEVVNVRVISSDHRCFDRAVIKAVSGWKYPPQRRTGLTETFTFRLED